MTLKQFKLSDCIHWLQATISQHLDKKNGNLLLIRTMTKKHQSDKDATSTLAVELLGLLFAFFTLGMLEMATFFFRKALRCFRKKKSSLNHNTIFK